MTYHVIRLREKPGYSLKRRARTALRRLFGTEFQKSQDLRFVTINGRRFKRLILQDSSTAARIERILERFELSGIFPGLVTRYENQVLLEFVDGERPREASEGLVTQVADFYATLYLAQPSLAPIGETSAPARLERNLRFLNMVGVLDDAVFHDLRGAALRLAPAKVWFGFDYVDPVLKNFVLTGEGRRLCAIDLEGLHDDQLIGSGVAQALMHWAEPFRHAFMSRLAERGSPDFQSYLPFVEMCFFARWTQTKVLTGKWKFVDPSRFERFRRG